MARSDHSSRIIITQSGNRTGSESDKYHGPPPRNAEAWPPASADSGEGPDQGSSFPNATLSNGMVPFQFSLIFSPFYTTFLLLVIPILYQLSSCSETREWRGRDGRRPL